METQKGKTAFRQGELLFIPVTLTTEQRKAFKGISVERLDRKIREGEVSGHIHEATSGTLFDIKRQSVWVEGESVELPAGQMFLTSENQIEITHPEHKTLTLDKGDYIIRLQREYEENATRYVND